MFPNMKMKIQRHTGTPWKELQERFIGYEPVIGDLLRLKRNGKLWKVEDIAWVFKPGKNNKFSHFDVRVG